MILRDGRGVAHDLGARRVFSLSDLKMAAGYGETASGRWANDMSFLFTRREPEYPLRDREARAAYVDTTSAERQRRYRELNRETIAERRHSQRRVARAAARLAL